MVAVVKIEGMMQEHGRICGLATANSRCGSGRTHRNQAIVGPEEKGDEGAQALEA